jgi:hypothetical protein
MVVIYWALSEIPGNYLVGASLLYMCVELMYLYNIAYTPVCFKNKSAADTILE